MNVQSVNFQGLTFVNVAKPTDFEMKYLKNTYDFDSLSLEDYVHNTQIPKIENYGKYNLVVLRFPVFGESSAKNSHLYGVPLPTFQSPIRKNRLRSSYVDMFVSKDYLVIMHEGDLPQINHIFNLCQKTLHNRNEYMHSGSTFLAYKIIDALVDSCFPVINQLTSTIDEIDKELEKEQSRKTLEDISTTRRNLVVFHTMLKPILPLFSELEVGKHKELNGPMQPYWSNILDHLQKIWDRVEDNQELIEGISESNESLLSSHSNQIIKVLTIFSTIVLPLNLLASIYGMNVALPFAENQTLFWELILSMFLGTVLMLVFLKWKRWF